jgi:hypothetical protein
MSHPGVKVPRKRRGFRVLLFTLSILMSFSFAYLQCDGLGQMHFLSSGLFWEHFQIADEEGLSTDSPAPLKEFALAALLNPRHTAIHPFQDLFGVFSQRSFSAEKLTLLRC